MEPYASATTARCHSHGDCPFPLDSEGGVQQAAGHAWQHTPARPPLRPTLLHALPRFAMRYHSSCTAGKAAIARGDELAMQARGVA